MLHRPRVSEASLFSAASPFAHQPPRLHDPLRSPEPLCEPSAQGLAPSSLSSLLGSPRNFGPYQRPQVRNTRTRVMRLSDLRLELPQCVCTAATQTCHLLHAFGLSTSCGSTKFYIHLFSAMKAVPGEDASDATLQSLLNGALRSPHAAAGGSVQHQQQQRQQHDGWAHGHSSILGGAAVPWLPPGPLSSWHGCLDGTAPLTSPLRLRPGKIGGLPLAAPSADACHTQASGLPGTARPPGSLQLRRSRQLSPAELCCARCGKGRGTSSPSADNLVSQTYAWRRSSLSAGALGVP